MRRLRSEDWETYRDVRLRALRDAPEAFFRTHAEESALPADEWAARTSTMAESTDSSAFLAVDMAGVAAGMAGGWRTTPERTVVWGVWVAPERRGAGLAAALMSAVEEWAADGDAHELMLEVADGNVRAAAFYERLGYRPNGARKPHRAGSGIMQSELTKPLRRAP